MQKIRHGLRGFHRDMRGQDMLEWVIGLPLFLLLCGAIAFYGWLWWNQTTAAIAIHDGAYLAAQRGGNTGAGFDRTMRILNAALGKASGNYRISIYEDETTRSVIGNIYNNDIMRIPYIGRMPLNIRAGSYQRWEQFYGGPPAGWW
jgi:Flp pilus assembly protein TadG